MSEPNLNFWLLNGTSLRRPQFLIDSSRREDHHRLVKKSLSHPRVNSHQSQVLNIIIIFELILLPGQHLLETEHFRDLVHALGSQVQNSFRPGSPQCTTDARFSRLYFLSIFARSASAVTPSEKSSINTNRKSATCFPMSSRWTSYVVPKPLKGGSKTQSVQNSNGNK